MLMIGICGASGSGKTTLARELIGKIDDSALLLSQDVYYLDHPEMSFEAREKFNYDEPDVFDYELIHRDLEALRAGRSILRHGYDYVEHRRRDSLTPIEPANVVVFEGIHAFYDAELRAMMDLKLFIKVDPDVCLLRRAQRDINERGRTIDGIAAQYLTDVKPMYEKHIRNYEKYADVIVARGGKTQRVVDMLAYCINHGMK